MGCRYVVIGETTVTKYGCPTDKYTAGQNLAEAAQWERVKDTDAGRMFAPVLSCEPDGSKLVMMRATPLKPTDGVRMDAFYDMLAIHNYHEPDPQTDNVGDLGGRTVAIDYGYRDMGKVGVRGGTCSTCVACQNYGKVERVGVMQGSPSGILLHGRGPDELYKMPQRERHPDIQDMHTM